MFPIGNTKGIQINTAREARRCLWCFYRESKGSTNEIRRAKRAGKLLGCIIGNTNGIRMEYGARSAPGFLLALSRSLGPACGPRWACGRPAKQYFKPETMFSILHLGRGGNSLASFFDSQLAQHLVAVFLIVHWTYLFLQDWVTLTPLRPCSLTPPCWANFQGGVS